MNRPPRALAASVLLLAGSALASTTAASATPARPAAAAAVTVKILTCSNTTVAKPTGAFVISCADANAELVRTRWTTWTASRAVGITTFGLNLCTPDCAASKISDFPGSTVVLSAPRSTKHGRLFSSMVITYKLKGKTDHFDFSWIGDSQF